MDRAEIGFLDNRIRRAQEVARAVVRLSNPQAEEPDLDVFGNRKELLLKRLHGRSFDQAGDLEVDGNRVINIVERRSERIERLECKKNELENQLGQAEQLKSDQDQYIIDGLVSFCSLYASQETVGSVVLTKSATIYDQVILGLIESPQSSTTQYTLVEKMFGRYKPSYNRSVHSARQKANNYLFRYNLKIEATVYYQVGSPIMLRPIKQRFGTA